MTKTRIPHRYFGTSWWVTVAQGFPFQEHLTTAQDSMSNSRLFGAKLNRYRGVLETCPQAETFINERSATALFSSFFQTRSSREYDSAPGRKYSRPLLDIFACIVKADGI